MMKARFMFVSLLSLSLSLFAAPLALAAPPPGATDGRGPIEEIVVTGEFRDSGLLQTTSSVSVVNLAESRAATVNHLEEILGWLPNVNYASGGARARFLQIRGIGERGQYAEPLNPSVGLIVDGVDFSGIGSTATLFDVEQVEVLRGPQGTLYGANALAGLVNVRTADPTEAFFSQLRLDAGDYGTRGLGAVVSGPASDRLGYRIAAQSHREDGFLENDYLGRDDTNERDELTVRGKLAWRPAEDREWTFVGGYIDADNGYDAFSLDNTRTTFSDEPGRDRQRATYGSAALRWDLSPAVAFQGTGGYAVSDSDYGYDEDWTYPGFDPDGYAATDRYLRDRDTATVDLRWLSGPAGRLFGDTTDWVVGLYGLTQNDELERRYTYAESDFDSRFEIDRLAVYAELERELGPDWRVTLGLRAEQHRARYRDSAGARFSPRDDMQGGRLVVARDLSERSMAYASVSRGYKAGGFNISGTLAPELREYDPELLWNYELGLKGLWLDGRLSARSALFTMQRDDVQVETSIVLVRPDGSAEFIDLIGNAAEGTNTGVELEVDYAVTDALSLFGALGLLDTEFDDFVNDNGEDLSGRQQAHAPRYQFHAGGEYRFAPGWFLRVETEGKDGFYFSNSDRLVPDRDQIRSQAFELWHASLGYEAPRWSLKLWMRNIGDEDYAVRGFYFGNDPRDGYADKGYTQLGEPRRYGVTFTLAN
jgi:outer membrane receptor protein involved in Fe transport